MTTMLAVSRDARERATFPRPHVGSVAVELAKLLNCSAKHAERRLRDAKTVLDRLPAAARAAGRADWLSFFAAHFDAERGVGQPIDFTAHLVCLINRAMGKEQQALVECISLESPEHRRILLAQAKRFRRENDELIASLEASR